MVAVAAMLTAGTILARTGYEAARVIDGDTFVTRENQIIRLAGIEAPEPINCGGAEAKAALEKLLIGKKVQLKVVFLDSYRRHVSYVYAGNLFVNQQMLAEGWAYISRLPSTSYLAELKTAEENAKAAKFGIWSDTCTQTENLSKPTCTIKGNMGQQGEKTKLYRYPGCGQYGNTIVQLYVGDRWFCSEKEARSEGFEKGSDCK